jgi:hypothetical protein
MQLRNEFKRGLLEAVRSVYLQKRMSAEEVEPEPCCIIECEERRCKKGCHVVLRA